MVTRAVVLRIPADCLFLYSMEHRLCQAALARRGAQPDLRGYISPVSRGPAGELR